MVTALKIWAKKPNKNKIKKKTKYCNNFTHMQMKNHAKKNLLWK